MIFLSVFRVSAQAQNQVHSPLFDQYIFNPLVINPAYAGKNQALSAIAHHRFQDDKLSGGSVIQTVSLHSPIGSENYNVGGIVSLDRFGERSRSDVLGYYAWRVPLKKGHLSLGVQGGLKFFGVDKESLHANSIAGVPDPELSVSAGNQVFPRFGGGIYYYSDKFFAGFALPDNVIYSIIFSDLSSELITKRFYTLTSGYTISLHDNFKVMPSFLLRISGSSPVLADINGFIIYKNRFSLGASYRTRRSLSLIGEVKVRQFSFGYSYERWAHRFSGITASVHEFVIRYDFRYFVKTVHPRNFR